MIPYFGTNDALPETRHLHAGRLSCIYENGNLRYIKLGQQEVVRMIYGAVRDENWMTLPYAISDEEVHIGSDHFHISYIAHFKTDIISYLAHIRLEGKPDNSIRFSMQGETLSTFKRNRIGICLLHPVKEYAGQAIQIIQPDGSSYQAVFPENVSPHQPFKNVSKMNWNLKDNSEVLLTFQGDVFETEDQRNWTDNSYKTYSTPLDMPHPVLINKGEQINQQVTLTVSSSFTPSAESIPVNVSFALTGRKYLFPQIGYSRAREHGALSATEIECLKQVPFDHYRVEVVFRHYWQDDVIKVVKEAESIPALVELIVYFDDAFESQIKELVEFMECCHKQISSILILHLQHKVTPEWLVMKVLPVIKTTWPVVKAGYGTDAYFAEFNRAFACSGIEGIDFVSYPINPQVHASDIRTLIENLQGQQYALAKTKILAPGKAIHISVSLKPAYKPDTAAQSDKNITELPPDVDVRQRSEFAAAWMLISLRYLCEAESVTFFETVGMRGIMQGSASAFTQLFPAHAGELYPVYHYLQKLYQFKPVYILESHFPNPFSVDGLILENAKGEIISFLVDFEKGTFI